MDAPWWYEGTAKILLQEFKFQRGWEIARFLAEAMAPYLPSTNFVLVPVPTRKSSLEARGWDPVETLWRELSRPPRLGRRLLRRKEGVSLKSLDRKTRFETIQSQLILADTQVPKEVVLLDDTFTTGATLNACAAVLVAAGARRVRALCATASP